MHEQDSLLSRWPLLVATLVLSLMFAWIFMISVERAVSARSAEELSVITGDPGAVSARGLEMTPSLGTLPETTPLSTRPRQPAPWWPALLFGLAFVSGWTVRHALRDSGFAISTPGVNRDETPADTPAHPVAADGERDVERLQEQSPEHARVLNVTSVRDAAGPDLTTDFPWDESIVSGLDGLSYEQRMAQLEKLNASKAEIIKALEKLVVENREKWLHQDETEARLNRHIEELSQDLQVAVRQLQDLRSDIPSRSGRARKKTG